MKLGIVSSILASIASMKQRLVGTELDDNGVPKRHRKSNKPQTGRRWLRSTIMSKLYQPTRLDKLPHGATIGMEVR